jgi:hypothetical protein
MRRERGLKKRKLELEREELQLKRHDLEFKEEELEIARAWEQLEVRGDDDEVIFVSEIHVQNSGKFDRGHPNLDAREEVITTTTTSNNRSIAPPIAEPAEDMVREKGFAMKRGHGSGGYKPWVLPNCSKSTDIHKLRLTSIAVP